MFGGKVSNDKLSCAGHRAEVLVSALHPPGDVVYAWWAAETQLVITTVCVRGNLLGVTRKSDTGA